MYCVLFSVTYAVLYMYILIIDVLAAKLYDVPAAKVIIQNEMTR